MAGNCCLDRKVCGVVRRAYCFGEQEGCWYEMKRVDVSTRHVAGMLDSICAYAVCRTESALWLPYACQGVVACVLLLLCGTAMGADSLQEID